MTKSTYYSIIKVCETPFNLSLYKLLLRKSRVYPMWDSRTEVKRVPNLEMWQILGVVWQLLDGLV